MKSRRCIAFVHSAAHNELWTPCGRPAPPGDVFCSYHRDAIAGVVFGLLDRQGLASESESAEEDACREALRMGASYFSNRYWANHRRAAPSGTDRRDPIPTRHE